MRSSITSASTGCDAARPDRESTFSVSDDLHLDTACSGSCTAFYDIGGTCEAATQTEGESFGWDEKSVETYGTLVGKWIPIETLAAKGLVKVVAPFTDSTVGVQIRLPRDSIGRVYCIDEDGDAEVRFPSLTALWPRERSRWIHAKDFQHLVKYEGELPETEGAGRNA